MTSPLLAVGSLSAGYMEFPLVLLMVYTLHAILDWSAKRRRMPPGPRGLPFLGNTYQLRGFMPWKTFAQWNKQYGPINSLFLGQTPVIVLGSAKAAWDLLDKRSDIYSSRPRFIMAGELLSNNMRGFLMPSGAKWRTFRKIMHGSFNIRKADSYQEIQSLESKVMMHELLHKPKDYEKHIRRYAASIIVSVAYGRRIDTVDDWIVTENVASVTYFTSINIPGKYLVESMPWLLKLPPSLQWFRHAPEERRKRDVKLFTHLVEDVKARASEGTCLPCMGMEALAKKEELNWNELQIGYVLASSFGAGIDTTFKTLLVFLLAMLHHPNAMKKAQAELDAVVGPERMPEFDDKAHLPYVNALISEVTRWRPVAVLGGAPHATTTDDHYEGMFIPKGSTVFANVYAIMRDPEVFPNPDAFLPERFLGVTDLRLQNFEIPFGFGRRICPGRHLAMNSLFINMARILWGFDLRPVKDAQGQDVLPDPFAFTSGFMSRPLPFNIQIKVRNDRVRQGIEMEFESAKEVLGKWQ